MGFQLTHPLPKSCLVAVSGGVDSVAALHWLHQVRGRVKGLVHLNHNTGAFAEEAENLVVGLSQDYGLDLHYYRIPRSQKPVGSLENFWRGQRYRFFCEVSRRNHDIPIVLAHNLDDCLEEYIMCTMVRGFVGTIPYSHGPCIRPFRCWKREDILEYARRNGLDWREDPANQKSDLFKRAHIRKNLIPQLRKLNPGIYKIAERAVREQDGKQLQARSSIG